MRDTYSSPWSSPGSRALEPATTWVDSDVQPFPNASSQLVSPFFTRLPQELRSEIYLHAFRQTYLPSGCHHVRPCRYSVFPLYQPRSTRPSLSHFPSLLLTCRKVYNEAAYLSVAAYEHLLIYGLNRSMCCVIPRVAPRYFERIQPWQLAAVRKLHICAEGRACNVGDELERLQRPEPEWEGFTRPDVLVGPWPSEITLTVRHWAWPRYSRGPRRGEGLTLDTSWVLVKCGLEKALRGVKVLRVLMEGKEADVDVLRGRMPDLEKSVFEAGDGKVLVCEAGASEWIHRDKAAVGSDGVSEEEESTVFEVVWKARRKGLRESDLDEAGGIY